MVTLLDEQDFLSEIKQPRESEEARLIKCREVDNGCPLLVVGTPVGNLLLYGGVFPFGIVTRDSSNDTFVVILREKMLPHYRNDMLTYLVNQFPDCKRDDNFLEHIIVGPSFGGTNA